MSRRHGSRIHAFAAGRLPPGVTVALAIYGGDSRLSLRTSYESDTYCESQCVSSHLHSKTSLLLGEGAPLAIESGAFATLLGQFQEWGQLGGIRSVKKLTAGARELRANRL